MFWCAESSIWKFYEQKTFIIYSETQIKYKMQKYHRKKARVYINQQEKHEKKNIVQFIYEKCKMLSSRPIKVVNMRNF